MKTFLVLFLSVLTAFGQATVTFDTGTRSVKQTDLKMGAAVFTNALATASQIAIHDANKRVASTNAAGVRGVLGVPAFDSADPGSSSVFPMWDDAESEIDWLTSGLYRTALGLDSNDAVTFGSVTVDANAYNATTWNGSLKAATEDAVRDKIESMGGGGGSGDVTAAENLTDGAPIVGDGGAKGIKTATGAVTFPAAITAGSATGVSITGANGIVTELGLGDGADENMVRDYNTTANEIGISSTTGAAIITSAGISLLPSANDGAALGSATRSWADLFLASGGVINFANGNYTLTHSSGLLTANGALSIGTGNAFTAGTIELGHASANTLSASSGDLSIEGVVLAKRTGGNTLGGAQTLAEGASITLDAAGSADGAWSGISRAGTAGATLAFGDPIYLDPSDSRWELVDANSASGADGDARGMIGICVLAAAADGDPTTILLQGVVRADAVFPALTINGSIYVSETAGDITQTIPTTEDNVVRRLGVATTADEIYFSPSDWYEYNAP